MTYLPTLKVAVEVHDEDECDAIFAHLSSELPRLCELGREAVTAGALGKPDLHVIKLVLTVNFQDGIAKIKTERLVMDQKP